MKLAVTLSAVALLALAPTISACELDETSAAASPAIFGQGSSPIASKAPAQKSFKTTVAKARDTRDARTASARTGTAAADTKVATAASGATN
ncbi:MAG: hypothetical protein ABIS17_10355 [Casimicrobiaceae bacterium]